MKNCRNRRSAQWARGLLAFVAALMAMAAGGNLLAAPSEDILHSFTLLGSDGGAPAGNLVATWFSMATAIFMVWGS
ncbi:MAG TPA: hypothetical protein VEK14_04000 [Rhodomicrobium sp.]|nr:hypothetical protein [Rhodomicrobium sp.]